MEIALSSAGDPFYFHAVRIFLKQYIVVNNNRLNGAK